MTAEEKEVMEKRLAEYKKCDSKIFAIRRRMECMKTPVESLRCYTQNAVDFDFLGEDFKNRLAENICEFCENEIKSIEEHMKEI